MRKIGILGGTFNPIHIGHLMLSEWAMDAAGLDEIWMIPAGQPYKKAEETILPGQERLHMVELAVLGNKRISCLDLEIKRKGYTYTYETLEELKSRFYDAEYYFILGADCLFSLEEWKRYSQAYHQNQYHVMHLSQILLRHLDYKIHRYYP